MGRLRRPLMFVKKKKKAFNVLPITVKYVRSMCKIYIISMHSFFIHFLMTSY